MNIPTLFCQGSTPKVVFSWNFSTKAVIWGATWNMFLRKNYVGPCLVTQAHMFTNALLDLHTLSGWFRWTWWLPSISTSSNIGLPWWSFWHWWQIQGWFQSRRPYRSGPHPPSPSSPSHPLLWLQRFPRMRESTSGGMWYFCKTPFPLSVNGLFPSC